MPLKIVRNDITKMNTEAIVNTANAQPTVGPGCDAAIYEAAGLNQLLKYRQEKVGFVAEGDVFLTPGFQLPAKYIIHAVSPLYIDGEHGEEDLLRSCYRKSLALAKEKQVQSIAFPLIATGGFGYPKEEGMRIAVDEINAFLLANLMDITLVVFDTEATRFGENIYPELQAYIDYNYVVEKSQEEYSARYYASSYNENPRSKAPDRRWFGLRERFSKKDRTDVKAGAAPRMSQTMSTMSEPMPTMAEPMPMMAEPRRGTADTPGKRERTDYSCETNELDSLCEKEEFDSTSSWDEDVIDTLNQKLDERLAHRADTFSEYLLYLIDSKGMKNVDVYKRAIVDKRYFAKLKNNKDFHPEKLKALCLCVGAQLSLDETKDLLARAGYALSPADMTDIIFSFYIEHKHFDVIDIDIQLEEHGLPCIIS